MCFIPSNTFLALKDYVARKQIIRWQRCLPVCLSIKFKSTTFNNLQRIHIRKTSENALPLQQYAHTIKLLLQHHYVLQDCKIKCMNKL